VQDDVARPVPAHLRSAGAADILDQALEFRVGFGAWPRTWAEFVHGMGHLSRAAAAEKLRIADAVAATKNPDGWQQWARDHRTLSGG
jgi:hypothetical protein